MNNKCDQTDQCEITDAQVSFGNLESLRGGDQPVRMDSERGTRDTSRDPAKKTSMMFTVHERAHTHPYRAVVHACAKFSQCAKSVLLTARSVLSARNYPSYDENSVGLADDLILQRCLAHTSVGHSRAYSEIREKKKTNR